MGTRGVIAEAYKGSWRGRYHHWDSYPTMLGETLWKLYNGHFKKDLRYMVKFLIQNHSHWSTINGKFDCMECHCGPEGGKKEPYLTPKDDTGTEWAYVLDVKKRTMTVLRHVWEEGGGNYTGYGFAQAAEPLTWSHVAVVKLDDKKVDWERIECGDKFQWCNHHRWVHDKTVCRDCDGKKFQYFSGHSTSINSDHSKCVPVEKLKGPIREAYFADPGTTKKDWHVYNPRTCEACGGTGKAKKARKKPHGRTVRKRTTQAPVETAAAREDL
jgi:hypothetical protein